MRSSLSTQLRIKVSEDANSVRERKREPWLNCISFGQPHPLLILWRLNSQYLCAKDSSISYSRESFENFKRFGRRRLLPSTILYNKLHAETLDLARLVQHCHELLLAPEFPTHPQSIPCTISAILQAW